MQHTHTHHPFNTPEGYFASLHDTVMAKVQAEQPIGETRPLAWHVRYRRALGVAACTLTAVLGISAYIHFMPATDDEHSWTANVTHIQTSVTDEDDIITEYIIDSDDIYSYLIDNQ